MFDPLSAYNEERQLHRPNIGYNEKDDPNGEN